MAYAQEEQALLEEMYIQGELTPEEATSYESSLQLKGQMDAHYNPTPTPPPEQDMQSKFMQKLTEYRAGVMPADKSAQFEELLKRKMPRIFHDKPMSPNRNAGDVLTTGVENAPGAMVELGKNMWQAVTNPVETAGAVSSVVRGGVDAGLEATGNLGINAAGEKLTEATGATGFSMDTEMDKSSPYYSKAMKALDERYPEITKNEAAGKEQDAKYWDAMSTHIAERYGSAEGFANAVETDLPGVMADAAGLFMLAGGTLSKVPGMARAGEVLTEAGAAMDPVMATGRMARDVAKPVAKLGEKVSSEFFGVTTGTGADTVRAAKGHTRSLFDHIEEKLRGKKPQDAGFQRGMRGNVSTVELADKAKTAIADANELRRQSFVENMDNMPDVDNRIAGLMDDLNASIGDEMQKLRIGLTDKGGFNYDRVSLNNTTRGQVKEVVERLMSHGSDADDLTPRGLMQLRDDLATLNSKDKKVQDLVNNLTGTIDETLNGVPGYKKLRADMDRYDDFITEFEKTLGLQEGKTGHEIVRKLISIGGEDVGLRRALLAALEDMTDSSISQEIAGIQMKGLLPTAMLTRAVTSGGINYVAGGGMTTLAFLAASSSPRLVGEFLSAYGYSRNTIKSVVDTLKKTGAFDQKVTTTAAITGRAQTEEETK